MLSFQFQKTIGTNINIHDISRFMRIFHLIQNL